MEQQSDFAEVYNNLMLKMQLVNKAANSLMFKTSELSRIVESLVHENTALKNQVSYLQSRIQVLEKT